MTERTPRPIAGATVVTELVSVSTAGAQGNQDSELPSVSADGRFVAFASFADNLVPEDTNLSSDIFVRDRLTGATQRVSVSSAGRQGDRDQRHSQRDGWPLDSADGRYVAFDSEATNLVRGDSNQTADVSCTGPTEKVTRAPDGSDANSQSFSARLNHDGRFVYFTSFASNLVAGDRDNGDVDAYLFDRQTATMTASPVRAGRGCAAPPGTACRRDQRGRPVPHLHDPGQHLGHARRQRVLQGRVARRSGHRRVRPGRVERRWRAGRQQHVRR